jgi:hypothetical protein
VLVNLERVLQEHEVVLGDHALASRSIFGIWSRCPPMKITNLSIRDFRGFRSLDLDLSSDVTALVGVNGAGKTSLLDAARR